MTAVLQYLGDTAQLEKKREEARKKRWTTDDSTNNPDGTVKAKGSSKGEPWKAWNTEQARVKAEKDKP